MEDLKTEERFDEDYVILISSLGDYGITDEEIEKLEATLGESFEVRRPYSNEAEGVYYRKSDGTLQILGYSLEIPEDVQRYINKCFEEAF